MKLIILKQKIVSGARSFVKYVKDMNDQESDIIKYKKAKKIDGG